MKKIYDFKVSILLIVIPFVFLFLNYIFFHFSIGDKLIPVYISSNIALIIAFFKIELDEHKEKNKIEMNNKRITLAYYNDLKTLDLKLKQNKYKESTITADIEIIDNYVKKHYNCEHYSSEILEETERAKTNVQVAKDRSELHRELLEIIKRMLLESSINVDNDLYNQLKKIQTKAFVPNTKNLDQIETGLQNISYLVIVKNGNIDANAWHDTLYPHLKNLDVFIIGDVEILQKELKVLIKGIENNSKVK
ncbi:hypothetical protein K4U46_09595 [Staphylococcus epidermidis]|nr:hypothetical protein [Staphylococcus epidermidis]